MADTKAYIELGAALWGHELGSGNTIFKNVPVGGYFKFKADIEYGRGPNRKTSERFYRTADGHVFKTGPYCTVFVEEGKTSEQADSR